MIISVILVILFFNLGLTLGLVNQNGICQQYCDLGFTPAPSNLCITCGAIGKVSQYGKCKDSCNTDFVPDLNNVCICKPGFGEDPLGFCKTCYELGMVSLFGVCTNLCPSHYTLSNTGECVICKNSGGILLYDQAGKCQSICNSGYKEDIDFICRACVTLGLFDQNGKCKTNCDANYLADYNNLCKPCKYNPTCVDECPFGTYASDFGFCNDCKSSGLVQLPNGKCSFLCPSGYFPDPATNICELW